MAILLTSGNPLGLRAIGSGGRTAAAAFEQITRMLRQTLGSEHAALFAEPSRRSLAIDWFAEADIGTRSVRLLEAQVDLRNRGLDRLDRLVHDIGEKAVGLQKSDRQDERILGEMLQHALEIPDEEAVFMVGEQPVMTFWGYVKDQGQPAVAPLQTLLRRRSPDAPLAAVPDDVAATTGMAFPIDRTAATPARLRARRSMGSRALPAILWLILLLLLLTCGVEVWRSCAIRLPYGLSHWLPNYCPGSGNGALAAALGQEDARQAELQAEYDELIRQATLRRQACLITPGKSIDGTPATPIPSPVKTGGANPPPEPQLKIPAQSSGTVDFLAGCWRSGEGLTEAIGGKDTGKKIKVTFCFKPDGSGTKTYLFEEDGAKCIAPSKATLAQEVLTIDIDDAPCSGNHVGFEPTVDKCRRGDGGVALCDEVPRGKTKPNFTDIPFTHTDE